MTETTHTLPSGARVIKRGELPVERQQMVDRILKDEANRVLLEQQEIRRRRREAK